MLTVPAVASLRRCAASTVRRAIALGQLHAMKHGRDWVVDEADLARWTPQDGPGRPRRIRVPARDG
jgi:hypothetical protein